MPNRIIKESIWTSPNLNELSDLAERHFYRILLLPDDFGCCEVTAVVVKGRCYPRKPNVSESDIEQWQEELEKQGLIIRWSDGGRQYAIFPSFGKHQRIRSLHQRRTPEPPDDVMNKLDDTCRQMSADDRLNPNPNPNPNLILDHWNQQNIIVHKKLADDVRSVIVRTLRSYSVEEVKSAISNYAEILQGPQYFFKYKWTLKDFLKRGIEKFMDIEIAKSNFMKEQGGKDKGRRLPKKYTPTEDYPDL